MAPVWTHQVSLLMSDNQGAGYCQPDERDKGQSCWGRTAMLRVAERQENGGASRSLEHVTIPSLV